MSSWQMSRQLMRFFALKAKQSYQDLTRNRRKLTSDEISRLSILCLLCQNLMDNLLPLSRITSWKKKDIKRSFQDFESGVLTGCHLCAIVFNLFSSEQREIFKDSRGCSYGVIAWKEFFVLSFEIILRESSRPVTSRPERTVTVVIVPEAEQAHAFNHAISRKTNCEENWRLAGKWLQNCSEKHECVRYFKDSTLPTRLLDVGLASGKIRLCITESLKEVVPYVTLSHCWGLGTLKAQTDGTAVSNPQLSRQTQKAAEFFMPVLRVENLQDMQEDIPFNSLSRTFQEAIFTTRRLGFRYLWIDSLCIIQDSREDWRKESVLMSTVYSGSQLNLAATSARNGTEGYFRDRNPSLVQPCKVRARTTGHGEGLFDCVDLNIWKKGVEESPLGLRGWVLQERVLAPRTLHFGETQMFWECNELCACETIPDKLDLEKYWSSSEPSSYVLRIKSIPNPPDIWFWEALVTKFSRSLLTQESDKLVAISGLGKFLQGFTQDEYFAGLWRHDIEKQLLWHVQSYNMSEESSRGSRRQGSYRPRDYRAPSWSWASVEGNVARWDIDQRAKKLIKVTDVAIVRAELDEFSQVRSGILSIQSKKPLISASIYQRSGPYWQLKFEGNGEPYHVSTLIDVDVEVPNITSIVYLMAIYDNYIGWGQKKSLGFGYLQGLILLREDQVKGQFRRLGIFMNLGYRTWKRFTTQAPVIMDESCYTQIEPSSTKGEAQYHLTIA